jgi:hypothetical protein
MPTGSASERTEVLALVRLFMPRGGDMQIRSAQKVILRSWLVHAAYITERQAKTRPGRPDRGPAPDTGTRCRPSQSR